MKFERHRWASKMVISTALLAAMMIPAKWSLATQDPPQDPSQKPPSTDAPPPAPKKQDSKPTTDSATQNADQPTWDPLRAEKDMEVGRYYLHKGDIDAAIDRFQDATTAKPGYALPFRFLGEAQEKKGMKKQAIKSYTRYLDLFPKAEDADKIHKKIEKLYSEVEKEKKSEN